MKTKEIREVFDRAASCVLRERIDDAIAELADLETSIAEKDKAILDGISNTYMLIEHCHGAYQEDAVAVEDIEAALSSEPTGKVLVDLEKLLELANGYHGTDGIELGLCPVCATKESHSPSCWLGNLPKESK